MAAATIHTFQGDEKDTIIFDTVDGSGGAKRAGRDISKDNPDEANLLNVAISRAKQRIIIICLLYTSPSPRDMRRSRMPSSA